MLPSFEQEVVQKRLVVQRASSGWSLDFGMIGVPGSPEASH